MPHPRLLARVAVVLAAAACAACAPPSAPPAIAPAVASSPETSAVPAIRAPGTVAQVPVAPATLDGLADVPAPVRLEVPRLAVDMPVVGVGVEADGAMELPTSALDAGWLRVGGSPGGGPRADRTAVMAAHVDDATVGLGPFARLRDAEPGDEVRVTLEDGSTVAYVVARVEQTAKRDVDVGEVLAADERALVLVTCGGKWDADVRHYEDNVLVWAVPEDAG